MEDILWFLIAEHYLSTTLKILFFRKSGFEPRAAGLEALK